VIIGLAFWKWRYGLPGAALNPTIVLVVASESSQVWPIAAQLIAFSDQSLIIRLHSVSDNSQKVHYSWLGLNS
jgi:hypothetical protein